MYTHTKAPSLLHYLNHFMPVISVHIPSPSFINPFSFSSLQNQAVNALLACNNASFDAALDMLQRDPKRKPALLSAIVEDETKRQSNTDLSSTIKPQSRSSPEAATAVTQQSTDRKERRKSPEKSPPAPSHPQRTDSGSQYDPADIPGRISPIMLPGFRTPVNFNELPPPPRYEDYPTMITRNTSSSLKYAQLDQDVHSDSSPTRTSPPYVHSTTPPYSTSISPEQHTHIHVSPPPEVHPQSYSPFSAPLTYRRETPPTYDHSLYKPPYNRGGSGYSTRITPTSEFSDSGIEEESTPRRPTVPPEAFKFFIEQHVENIVKSYHQRLQRRHKLEQEMAKRHLDDATSEQMRRILYQKESNFLRLKRAKMHKDMFNTVKPLGIGAFGVVSLVRKVDTNKLYAMKTLRKADVLRRNQVAHVKAERDILAEADNEWVVKLFFSFQDIENLYFVMEYIPGGDMMSLLIKLGTFPEHLTLFYIAELVCAIESVHRMGFIHRDIKPDNILIGADGHIKLTDFGLCTGFRWTHDSKRYLPKGHHQRNHSMEPGQWEEDCTIKPLELRRVKDHHNRSIAHSLVGTPNYIAPEILRRVGYTQLCDWWSVGVIMYEMLVGQPPFMAPTPSETQLKIMNWSHYLHIPRHAVLSQAAADLILSLCCDQQDRIGRNGVEEIKMHPFFSAVDWKVGIRNYEPPYIPKIMYESDTSNFDPIPQSQLQKLQSRKQDVSSLPKGQPEHAFYEWTFIRFYPDRGTGREKKPTLAPSTSSPYSGGGASGSGGPGPSSESGRGSPSHPSHMHAHHAPHYHNHHATRPAVASPPMPHGAGGMPSPSTPTPTMKDKRKSNPQPVYV